MLKHSFVILSLLAGSLLYGQTHYIHHQISATVIPEEHRIQYDDNIRIPAALAKSEIFFRLNSDLTVTSTSPLSKVQLIQRNVPAEDSGMDQEAPEVAARISQNRYVLKSSVEAGKPLNVALKISGTIFYPIKQIGQEYARGFSTTPGLIDTVGVYLAGSTDWIPLFGEKLLTFDLTVTLPPQWDMVSQGKRTLHQIKEGRRLTTWHSPEPMEEVFLIAAKFHEYDKPAGAVDVMAFLRTPDEALAGKYLETTAQYLEMYRNLIGPFPFAKFALVENFWETGYGMPSFTLLGEKIIRFPFILHSSYPHELLHNWWGNSAYVNFKKGNWCEGLTVYMADQLIKEQRGQGAAYRRSTLQKYTDYVSPENDFPLNQFLSRTSAPTEAVGYGKSMMLFNMLRDQIGDDNFMKTIRTFYRQNKFKFASFDDIRRAAEQVTGKDFKAFFHQWVDRTGAPKLQLSQVERHRAQNAGYELSFQLNQIQPEAVFNLLVPVAVTTASGSAIHKVVMNQKQQAFTITVREKPLLVEIDPQFQLFRRLDPMETPPALSKIMGSKKVLFLLPASASKERQDAYKQLAGLWSKEPGKSFEMKYDSEVGTLPADRAVWLFGVHNRYRPMVEQAVHEYPITIQNSNITLDKTEVSLTENSVVLTARHPNNPSSVVCWLTLGQDDAVAGLARKLPHYGKYSYLAFEGSEPGNIAKGQWPVVHSPLSFRFADAGSVQSKLPVRPALAKLAPVFSAKRMMQTIRYLSSDELKGRGLGTPELDHAADYIAAAFGKAGLQPGTDDGTYFQTWQDVVNANGDKGTIKNIIGILPGANPKMAGESVVVSAHYDHLGLGWPDAHKGDEGKIHHGADDNASGIAVMLELARIMAQNGPPQRTIVFVAFTAEENGLVGSRYYVQHYQTYPARKAIGDINLDTVGRLGKNKLLVLNSSTARDWKFIFMGAGYVTGVESEMVTQQLDASDQGSFIAAGIPAVQIFSGAHRDYHRPTDTADKIDPAGLVKVAAFTREAIAYLAERDTPMPFTGTASGHPHSRPKTGGATRSVTTGSMPDFSYTGSGVRIADAGKDSPAARAGLQKGDIIIQLGTAKITTLRDYANALKHYKPGDETVIKYLRDGKEQSAKIKLSAR